MRIVSCAEQQEESPQQREEKQHPPRMSVQTQSELLALSDLCSCSIQHRPEPQSTSSKKRESTQRMPGNNSNCKSDDPFVYLADSICTNVCGSYTLCAKLRSVIKNCAVPGRARSTPRGDRGRDAADPADAVPGWSRSRRGSDRGRDSASAHAEVAVPSSGAVAEA